MICIKQNLVSSSACIQEETKITLMYSSCNFVHFYKITQDMTLKKQRLNVLSMNECYFCSSQHTWYQVSYRCYQSISIGTCVMIIWIKSIHILPTVNKTRTFYEFFSIDSNSISIKYLKDPNDPLLKTHSTIQILKVLVLLIAVGLKWNPEGNALVVALKGFLSQYSGSICKTVDDNC